MLMHQRCTSHSASAPRSVDRRIVSAFTYHHRHRATVAGYLETARRLIPELRRPFSLQRITIPVLLVWGDRDRLVFHSGAEQVLSTVPGARLELLHGIGHCPQVEAPARLAELLLEVCRESLPAVA